jgi:hypothetical protein
MGNTIFTDIITEYCVFQLSFEFVYQLKSLGWTHLFSGFGNNNKNCLIFAIMLQKSIDINYNTLEGNSNASNIIITMIDYKFAIFNCKSQIKIPDSTL